MPQQSPATCQSAAAIGAEVNVWVLGRSLFATLSEAKLTWFGQAESVEDDPLPHFVAAHFRIAANILFCEYRARGRLRGARPLFLVNRPKRTVLF